MLHDNIQPIHAEDLPPEEYRFIKAQKAIYDLFVALERDEELRAELKTAESPDNFTDIAASQGYEFSASDLQAALGWALEKTEFYSDEFDDYELSDEELEMVAGGRAMARYSYWHNTGILISGKCFNFVDKDLGKRTDIVNNVFNIFTKWEYQGNNTVKASKEGDPNSYRIITGITYNGDFDESQVGDDYTSYGSLFDIYRD